MSEEQDKKKQESEELSNEPLSAPQNKEEVEKYTPEPDKDGKTAQNEPGDAVKVEDGKATPTDAAASSALEKQQPGGETSEAAAEERKRDAQAAVKGNKETAEISGAASQGETKKAPMSDEERAARRAARAAAQDGEAKPERPARAKAQEGAEEAAKPKEPSPNQPQLDRIAAIIRESVGEPAVDEASINERSDHLPMVTIRNEDWFKAAQTLKEHNELSFQYLRNVSGVDQETHLEVVYHLLNLETKRQVGVRVKTDREQPSISSVTPLWATANWNEREVFDLLGIDFPGHPDLRRIMMSDDWEGHPLRKDYEPLDPEV